MSLTTYKIASIPADGIGPEVIDAGITVLKKLVAVLGTFDLEFEAFPWSSDYFKQHGKYLPDDALDTLKNFDAILFGAVGAPGMYAQLSPHAYTYICLLCMCSCENSLINFSLQTYLITSPSGVSVSQSASRSNNTQTSVRQKSSAARSRPFVDAPQAIWTGLLSARIPKGNTLARGAGATWASRGR